MVLINLPAKMTCDEANCMAHTPVQLALNAEGGLAFKPVQSGWQVGANPAGVLVSRCQKHHQTLVAPPEGLRVTQ